MRRFSLLTLALCLAPTARAGVVTPVTSRAALPGADDSLTIRSLGPSGVALPAPLAAVTAGGVAVTLERLDPARVAVGTRNAEWAHGLGGDFLPGEAVLLALPGSYGPLEVAFAAPVSAAGLQIQAGLPGAFTAQLEVYAGATLLGTFTNTGVSGSRQDDSAPFLGVADTAAEITRLVYSLASAPAGLTGAFAVNQLDLTASAGTHPGVQVRVAAPQPPPNLPEPSALALLGIGLSGSLGLAWRRRMGRGRAQ